MGKKTRLTQSDYVPHELTTYRPFSLTDCLLFATFPESMKCTSFVLLAVVVQTALGVDNSPKLRGPDDRLLKNNNDNNGQGQGPPEHVLAKLELQNNISIEFKEVNDDIYTIVQAPEDASEFFENLIALNEDDDEDTIQDPVKFFKKVNPNGKVPKALKDAKEKVDKKKKEEEENPTEYDEIPEETFEVAEQVELDDGGEGRRLSSQSYPSYPHGSPKWFKWNWGCSESYLDNTNCMCYIGGTGNYAGHIHTGNMMARVFAKQGGVAFSAYTWEGHWKYETSVWVPEGEGKWIQVHGSKGKNRQARIDNAVGKTWYYSIFACNAYEQRPPATCNYGWGW